MSSLFQYTAEAPPPDDLYITEELALREDCPVDYKLEAAALQQLAAQMSEDPEQVLPRLVELAMTLTGASSAGLSLYEPDPAPGVFRWRHLKGVLAPFENATTPRNHSPCGVTLDRTDVTLSRNPERYYEWISAENIIVPEVLLVPLYVNSDTPAGTLWIVAEHEGQFRREHARVSRQLAEFVGLSLRMQEKERQLRAALDEQEMLAREMSHRLKNIFAMTEGMIRISARNTETADDMAGVLSGRLLALASAHSLVRGKASDVGLGNALDLRDLIAAVVKAHQVSEFGEQRFSLRGPPVACGDHSINGIALLIHEFATNAAKYGALTTAGGKVAVSWLRQKDRIVLRWQETGGPVVPGPPSQSGFGTTLATRTVTGQFGGDIEMDWTPGGLKIEMSLLTNRVAQ